MSPFYKFLKVICTAIFKLLWFVKITPPKDELENRGGVVCSNHISAVDPVFLGLGMKRQIWFFAKAEIWKVPVLRLLAKKFAVSVNRGAADIGAMRKAIDVIKGGKILTVFPQGTRRRNVRPADTAAKNGIAMMAYRAKCDVIPAYIHTKNYKVRIFRRVSVIYGEPIRYSELGFVSGDSAELERAAKYIWERICALAPTEDK